MTSSSIQSKVVKDDFHRERSRFIDAFAGLEEVLLRLPKADIDKTLTDEIKALRSIRNDLVHSQLRFVSLEGQLHAIALNVQDKSKVARQGRFLKIGDFGALSSQIEEVRRKAEALARPNPASSPPPPSRAAAGGP